MTDIEIAQKQLEQFYSVLAQEKQRVIEIRKWAVTVWLAIVVALASNRINLTYLAGFIIPLLPLMIFWLFEGLQQMWITVDGIKSRQIEEFISEYTNGQKFPKEYYYSLSYGTITYSKKIILYLKSMFITERVCFFYLLLIILSFLLSLINTFYVNLAN